MNNPLEAERLCERCEDTNRVEVTDASGCYPTGESIDCDECPRCDECRDFISSYSRELAYFNAEEYFFLCPDCKPKERSELDRAADLTRGMIALMRTNY